MSQRHGGAFTDLASRFLADRDHDAGADRPQPVQLGAPVVGLPLLVDEPAALVGELLGVQ
jgi:hypothetical protein